MTDSMSEVVERLAHIACPAVVQDGPCSGCSMKERGPHGGVRGCILDATRHVERLLAELSAMGLVVVPREPTEDMRLAGVDAGYETGGVSGIYRAMLTASPKVQP